MLKRICEKEKQQLEQQLIGTNKNITEQLLEELEKMSENLQKIPEDIDKYQLDKYIEIINENQESKELQNYKEQLNALKTLVECKKTTNNSLFSLTKQQEDFIKQFATKIQKFLILNNQIQTKNGLLTQQIKVYQSIIETIENNQNLGQEELLELNKIIQNRDEHEQNKILKSYLEYNLTNTNIKHKKEQQETQPQISKVRQIEQKTDIITKSNGQDEQNLSEERAEKIYENNQLLKENKKNKVTIQ